MSIDGGTPRDGGVLGAKGKRCIKEEEVPLISKVRAVHLRKDYGNPGLHSLFSPLLGPNNGDGRT